MFIYHLITPEDWEVYLNRSTYSPPSLKEEGFIHCSTKEQLLNTAEVHYEGAKELVVLKIREKRVSPILKWEPSRDGKLFPHLYGSLSFHKIETTNMLYKNQRGEWVWGE